MAFGAVGDGDDDHDATDAAVGDEGFRTVDDPAVALTRGRRPHAGGIAAGASFGKPPGAPHVTLHETREKFLLLFVGTEERDMGRAQPVVRGDRERD